MTSMNVAKCFQRPMLHVVTDGPDLLPSHSQNLDAGWWQMHSKCTGHGVRSQVVLAVC